MSRSGVDRRAFLAAAVGVAASSALGCGKKKKGRHSAAAKKKPPPELGLAPAAADVTAHAAILWAHASGADTLHFEYATRPDFTDARRTPPAPVGPEGDHTLAVEVTDLAPGTRYHYRAVATTDGEDAIGSVGTFTTPSDAPAPVRLVWSADLLEREAPFKILDAAAQTKPDLVLLIGDLAYVDHPKSAPARDLVSFQGKHRGVRRDPSLQRLLTAAPVVATWDDHDCVDSCHRDTPFLAPARKAFRDYWPLRSADPANTGLYRSLHWGPHLDLFVLDTRSFRDNPRAPVRRTMLGSAQRAWLEGELRKSRATHKIIVSSVPFLAPFEDDSWFGYAEERDAIKKLVREEHIAGVTILSGDFHLAWHLEDSDAKIHEFVAGPLAAWPFKDIKAKHVEAVQASNRFALMDARNYGVLEIDAAGKLSVAIHDASGHERYRTTRG